ncbi:hypothetical protein LXA43DRAFT_895617, partial [Ganoderma leucocontextum]
YGFSGLSSASPLYAAALPGHAVQGQQQQHHDNQSFTGGWVIAETPSTIAITTHQSDLHAHITPPLTLGRPLQGVGDGLDGGGAPPPGESPLPQKRNPKRKIHACVMCTKSFDSRPSTLKKHLSVHTREKAFVCEGCSRRFGFGSNLNRHKQTCRLLHVVSTGPGTSAAENSFPSNSHPGAPSNSHVTSGTSPTSTIPSSSKVNSGSTAATDAEASVSTAQHHQGQKGKRAEGNIQSRESGATAPEGLPRPRKRARRAPSPVHWVPESLQMFNLTPVTTSTPVPLPPVRPSEDPDRLEERDSFDENASLTPYHPQGWSGRLPGPGLLDSNVTQRSGGQIMTF